MIGDLKRSARLLVLATLALLAVVALVPGRVELATRVYALVLCAVAIVLALSALRRAFPPATSLRTPAAGRGDVAPASVARLEHVISLGAAGAFDLHHRLVPRLRALAEGLLVTRRRITLNDAEHARELVGAETWELVRPDRPAPEDRLAGGVPLPDLERAVASLERI